MERSNPGGPGILISIVAISGAKVGSITVSTGGSAYAGETRAGKSNSEQRKGSRMDASLPTFARPGAFGPEGPPTASRQRPLGQGVCAHWRRLSSDGAATLLQGSADVLLGMIGRAHQGA